MLVSTSFVSAAPLRDVPSSHWAKGAVDELVNDYGFMQGDPNGYFGGNRALTRYEFAKTISRLVEYYNTEIDSDRKDIENMVSIMELFQNELKVLEGKLNTVSETVNEQNEIIGEINELAVTIGEEYQSQEAGASETSRAALLARINELETDVGKVQNKGLFIDTIIKGTYNDIKKLGKATARVVSRSRKNVGGPKIKYVDDEDINIDEAALEKFNQPNMQQPNAIPQDQLGDMAPQGAPPVGAGDGSYYNPYDVELMEDLGQQ